MVRRKPNWRARLIALASLMVLVWIAWAVIERATALKGNTDQSHFDAIIVLGNKPDSDGNPSPRMLARVTEAVHEYERGVAPRLIVTGGMSRKPYVESVLMAHIAEAQGVPASAIVQEPQALDTIHNACYSAQIMKAHGWQSAEVVSSPTHLARAAILFSKLPVKFRLHAAPPLEPQSGFWAGAATSLEVLRTMKYLAYGQWAEPCSP